MSTIIYPGGEMDVVRCLINNTSSGINATATAPNNTIENTTSKNNNNEGEIHGKKTTL